MPNQECWRNWSWTVLWRLTRPFRSNTPKIHPFHFRELECKVGSQETPGVTGKFNPGIWNEAGQTNRVLPRKCAGHNKHPLPTTQEKTLYMDITRWSTPKSDWLYSVQPKMKKLYTVSQNKPGADCGSDHELLIIKFSLNWKKVGKTTRPFR